ncbi:D-2-hydroxyacid dehydrogenase [Marinicellulosiphila megalodicopiae]|uniref:D-2-hydroxyacid dehydrogenase n=1 Tax=Marinicellulosiphila megalodicopiae TaxID=2724896 RepID=UPI003BAECB7D
MFEVVFLDRATLAEQIQFKKLAPNSTYIEYSQTLNEQTVDRLKNATIAITNKVILDAKILSQLPQLKCICVAATGFNIIDLQYCKQKNITVTNITNYAKHTVSEHVFMLMLCLTKQLKSYERTLKENAWQKSKQFCYFTSPIHLLKGKTLGLIGTGEIAKQTAKIASAFAMKVNFYSPSNRHSVDQKTCVDLNTILSTSDIISIHCPLNKDTESLISEKELLMMKKNCILINTARGPIVDSFALINALQNKTIGAAGLDVLPTEPPHINDIAMQNLMLDNLIITPHIAWASIEAMQILADQLIDKVNAFLTNSLKAQDNLSTL